MQKLLKDLSIWKYAGNEKFRITTSEEIRIFEEQRTCDCANEWKLFGAFWAFKLTKSFADYKTEMSRAWTSNKPNNKNMFVNFWNFLCCCAVLSHHIIWCFGFNWANDKLRKFIHKEPSSIGFSRECSTPFASVSSSFRLQVTDESKREQCCLHVRYLHPQRAFSPLLSSLFPHFKWLFTRCRFGKIKNFATEARRSCSF